MITNPDLTEIQLSRELADLRMERLTLRAHLRLCEDRIKEIEAILEAMFNADES